MKVPKNSAVKTLLNPAAQKQQQILSQMCPADWSSGAVAGTWAGLLLHAQ
jgi:hypothetical protein